MNEPLNKYATGKRLLAKLARFNGCPLDPEWQQGWGKVVATLLPDDYALTEEEEQIWLNGEQEASVALSAKKGLDSASRVLNRAFHEL